VSDPPAVVAPTTVIPTAPSDRPGHSSDVSDPPVSAVPCEPVVSASLPTKGKRKRTLGKPIRHDW
jgi:hypothetical protein